MGMRDESWCAGCGGHIEYTEDESAMCGDCGKNEVLEYIKSHLSDLLEERENVSEFNESSEWDYISGAIESCEHILAKFGVNE